MSRSRAWCYTSFEGSIADRIFEAGASYVIQGKEYAPDTGRKHWQGYCYFDAARSLKSMKKICGSAHLEASKGSAKANIKYCSKDGNVLELGEPPCQGKRTDLETLVDHFKDGGDIKGAIELAPGTAIRNWTNLCKLETLFAVKRNWIMDVRIYWGAPGCGKTRSVWDEFGVDNVYAKPKSKWWDGYVGQPVVLIDDFDPMFTHDCAFDYYLTLLDRYPMYIEVKGGTMSFRSKIIIFTSNFDPKIWFEGRENKNAFFRRVTQIKKFDTEVV